MSAPETKANGLLTAAAVAKEWLSEAEWQEVLASIPADLKSILDKPPLAMEWIPAMHIMSLIDTLASTVWKQTPERIVALGGERMKRDLGGVYKLLIKLTNPQTIIKRAPSIYDRYTRNNGSMSAEATGKNEATVGYTGLTYCRPTFWDFQRGAIVGTLESTGAKDVTVTLKEGGGTALYAVFVAKWR